VAKPVGANAGIVVALNHEAPKDLSRTNALRSLELHRRMLGPLKRPPAFLAVEMAAGQALALSHFFLLPLILA
jgi:hypothetical protein